MNHDTRRLARWAGHLHAGLQRLGRGKLTALSDEVGRLSGYLERVRQLRARLLTCLERGWHAAARDVRRELDYALGDIDRATTLCDQLLRRSEPAPPTPRFVFDELRQLHDEFDEIKFDAAHATISVTTEPITLEGLRLGRFEIRLELGRTSDADPASFLRIVALEPNPASCDSTVTHPHVRDERICLGEAAAPIQQALAEGRVCDLFILVRAVLQTYNADSPFISLDQLGPVGDLPEAGIPICRECGDDMELRDGAALSTGSARKILLVGVQAVPHPLIVKIQRGMVMGVHGIPAGIAVEVRDYDAPRDGGSSGRRAPIEWSSSVRLRVLVETLGSIYRNHWGYENPKVFEV